MKLFVSAKPQHHIVTWEYLGIPAFTEHCGGDSWDLLIDAKPIYYHNRFDKHELQSGNTWIYKDAYTKLYG